MVNGEATNGDHSDKNGVAADTEKETSETETKQNGNAVSPTKEVNKILIYNKRGLCTNESINNQAPSCGESKLFS